MEINWHWLKKMDLKKQTDLLRMKLMRMVKPKPTD